MKRFWLFAVLALVFVQTTGCGPSAPPASKTSEKSAASHDDHHHGDAPHGGTLLDWGGGAYHVEFTVDHDKKETVVYIIGSDAKSPAPIKADKIQLSISDPAFQIELEAKPLEGEADGKSSRFVGQHESLGKVQEFAGTISGEVEGTPYTGDFKELPHADHKH